MNEIYKTYLICLHLKHHIIIKNKKEKEIVNKKNKICKK